MSTLSLLTSPKDAGWIHQFLSSQVSQSVNLSLLTPGEVENGVDLLYRLRLPLLKVVHRVEEDDDTKPKAPSDGTLGFIIGFGRKNGVPISYGEGSCVPPQIFGVTGWSEVLGDYSLGDHLEMLGCSDGREALEQAAVVILVCLIRDYVLQGQYRELWQRNDQEVRTDGTC